MLAKHVHEGTSDSAMLWAPNSGAGYPFEGGAYCAVEAAKNFLLDTDGDGVLDMSDDMYTPYYPGGRRGRLGGHDSLPLGQQLSLAGKRASGKKELCRPKNRNLSRANR